MDATVVAVAAISAVPATIAAIAGLVSARRSKHAERASAAAEAKSTGAALSVDSQTQRLNTDMTFLIHMLSDHISDERRHVHRRK